MVKKKTKDAMTPSMLSFAFIFLKYSVLNAIGRERTTIKVLLGDNSSLFNNWSFQLAEKTVELAFARVEKSTIQGKDAPMCVKRDPLQEYKGRLKICHICK